MSTLRAGRNYFRLIKEKFIPGAELVESTSYNINLSRTSGDWHIGRMFRNLRDEHYPFYLNEEDSLQGILVVGKTGRGKTNFAHVLVDEILQKSNDITTLIFNAKSNEWIRFFLNHSNVLVYHPGSEEAPLGLSLFQLDFPNEEHNKRFLKHTLQAFLNAVNKEQGKLSPRMYAILSKAINCVLQLPKMLRSMRNLVDYINEELDELEAQDKKWVEETRMGLISRFDDLFAGWFRNIFSVSKSNFNPAILKEKNVIIDLSELIKDNDVVTAQIIVNYIISMIKQFSMRELRDREDKPLWLVTVFEEADNFSPARRKFDASEKDEIESWFKLSRGFGVANVILTQIPEEVSTKFRQAGIVVDCGTESRELNDIFNFEDFRKEKTHLNKKGMGFLKMDNFSHRILFQSRLFKRRAMTSEETLDYFWTEEQYYQLRDEYRFEEISRADLLGSFGRKWEAKKELIAECRKNCDRELCAFINNKFEVGVGYKLKKLTTSKIHQMFFKRDTLKDYVWNQLNDENKEDAPCVFLKYLSELVPKYLPIEEAKQVIRETSYFEDENTFNQEVDEGSYSFDAELDYSSPFDTDETTSFDDVFHLTDFLPD